MRTLEHLIVLVLISLSVVSSASGAKSRSLPGNDAGTVGAIELRKTAECMVQRQPRSTSNFLATRPLSRDEQRIANSLNGTITHCMTGYVESLTAGYTEMRGFLAEAFYLRANPVDPNFGLMKHDEVPLPEDWIPDRNNSYQTVAIEMLKFGSCVAAADPKGVVSLMRTGVRSNEERTAINQLRPHLGPCLNKGFTFRLDTAILRALTAQSLYRSLDTWLKSQDRATSSSTSPGSPN